MRNFILRTFPVIAGLAMEVRRKPGYRFLEKVDKNLLIGKRGLNVKDLSNNFFYSCKFVAS